LFYNISDFSLIDYVGGLEDLGRRVIRTIGDPEQRFMEDPVRMMRAVEYASRLDFALEGRTAEAVATMASELRRAAAARIAYELLESLKGGQSQAIFTGLLEHGLLAQVAPEADGPFRRGRTALQTSLLGALDRAVARGEEVGGEAQLGVLLVPAFLDAIGCQEGRAIAHPDLERVARDVLAPVALRLSFSHYRAHVLRNALVMLARLTAPPKSSKMVIRTVRHEAFPTAWQLARLLAEVGGAYGEGVRGWDLAIARLQEGRPPVEEARPEASVARRRRRRRRRKPAPVSPEAAPEATP
jgi:poly(A) polymerase